MCRNRGLYESILALVGVILQASRRAQSARNGRRERSDARRANASENERKRVGGAVTHIYRRQEEAEVRASGPWLEENTCGQRAHAKNRSRALHMVLSSRERSQRAPRVKWPG